MIATITEVVRFNHLFHRSGWGDVATRIMTSIAFLIDSRRDGKRSLGLLGRIERGRLSIRSSMLVGAVLKRG